jgi:hypothetical protein
MRRAINMARRGWRASALATALMLVPTVGVSAGPSAADLFYQRALMVAADGDCRLFSPDLRAALAASKAQARAAALRSGDDPTLLVGLEAKASAVAVAAGCGSSDMTAAAQRVRAAFDAYARLSRLEFAGEFAPWLAVRAEPSDEARWRVSQRDRFGWDVMVFGLAAQRRDVALTAVSSFADGARPYGARLVMRDASVTERPYLDVSKADIAGRIPIDARLPPRSAALIFTAQDMAPAEPGLKGAGMTNAWTFRFPAAASDALAALDPREAVAVEFLVQGEAGEDVRIAYVEVGDFAAARAFQAINQR